MEIWTIRTGFQAFDSKFKQLEWKFEPFEQDSKYSNASSNHSNGIWSFRMQIRTTTMDSKQLNANSNHLNEIQTQILTIQMGFETIECKFKP